MRQNFKLQFSKPKFDIHPEQRVVVCYITGRVKLPKKIVTHTWFDNTIIKGKGVAIASDVDIFDESIGKKVALAKAEKEAYMKAYSWTRECIKTLTDIKLLFQEFQYKARRVVEHNEDYLSKF